MKYTYVALILLLLAIAGCTDGQNTGRVVFAITDAAADMGTVTNVSVTIDSIKVRNNEDAWVTATSDQQTFDLLELKAQGTTALLADVQLPNGTYTEIRLEISKVVVTDENGSHDAKLPSGELKLKGTLVVEGNSTSSAVFDFIADESLHTTGSGQYVMAPVIQIETRQDANVNINGENVVVAGGTVKTNAKLGMDINGNVGAGLKIATDAAVDIEGGVLKVTTKAAAKPTNATAKVGVTV
jgi:hypothetical protein